MKKILTLLVPLMVIVAACTPDSDSVAEVTGEDVAATLTELGAEAEELVDELEGAETAEINDVLSVVRQNTTNVALAATGGDVSEADVERLVTSLGDLQLEIDAARDALDPTVAERLDSLRSDIQSALDQLDR